MLESVGKLEKLSEEVSARHRNSKILAVKTLPELREQVHWLKVDLWRLMGAITSLMRRVGCLLPESARPALVKASKQHEWMQSIFEDERLDPFEKYMLWHIHGLIQEKNKDRYIKLKAMQMLFEIMGQRAQKSVGGRGFHPERERMERMKRMQELLADSPSRKKLVPNDERDGEHEET